MLKFLRNKKTQKKIYIGLALVIIPSFLFWGVMISEEGKQTNPNTALGRIENHSVSVQEYLKSYHAVQHQVALVYGEQAKMIARFIDFKSQAWDRLLLLTYAKSEKLKTGDSEVVDYLASQPVFIRQGKFDDKFYKAYVTNYLRMSVRDFEEEIRQMLTIHKIQEKMGQRIQLSEEELKALYDSEYGEKDIVYGILSWESQKEKVLVSDEELSAVYPLLKDKLQEAGSETKPLSIEEAKSRLKDLMIKQKATETAVKQLDQIRSTLGTADFEKTLKSQGIEVKHAEKFTAESPLPGIGPYNSFERMISGLKEGDISRALATPTGAAIIQIAKASPADPQKFEKDKTGFKEKMVDKKVAEKMDALLNKLRQKLTLNADVMNKLFQKPE